MLEDNFVQLGLSFYLYVDFGSKLTLPGLHGKHLHYWAILLIHFFFQRQVVTMLSSLDLNSHSYDSAFQGTEIT